MVISRKKKIVTRMMDRLGPKAELSDDKGNYLYDPSTRKLTKKQKRHSGRKTPLIPNPTMKYNEIKENALEPEVYYDDWEDWRDSWRDFYGQRKTKVAQKKYTRKMKFLRKIKFLRKKIGDYKISKM